MRIKPTDLEPGLRRRVEGSLHASERILPMPPPPPPGPRMTFGRAFLALLLTLGLWAVGFVMTGAVASLAPEGAGEATLVASLLGAPALAGYWLRNGWGRPVRRLSPERYAAEEQRRQAAHRARVRETPMDADTVRDVLRLTPPKTEADEVYARTALLLLDLTDEGRMAEAQARDILAQVNGLMESDRELASRREGIASALDPAELEEMNARREKLVRTRDTTTDPEVRKAAEMSLSALDNRHRDTRELAAAAERIDAQRDAVGHTLESLASSLARMQVTAGVNDAAEVGRLQETAADLYRQTRSTEQAVAEVVRLSAGPPG